MEKKAVCLGRTREWSENGLSVRPDPRHVRSLLRELGNGELSKYLHATLCQPWRRNEIEVTFRRVSPQNILLLFHGLCTRPRIDWIWKRRQLSSPKPWHFRERVTTNVSNVLHLHGHPDYLQWYPFQEDTYSCFDHGCRLGHVQRITPIEFRWDSAVGESAGPVGTPRSSARSNHELLHHS